MQHRLTPLQRTFFGGCQFDRPIDDVIGAAGFDLRKVDTYYLPGPRFIGHTFEGIAAPAPGALPG